MAHIKLTREQLLKQPIETIEHAWFVNMANGPPKLLVTIRGSDGVSYGDILLDITKRV